MGTEGTGRRRQPEFKRHRGRCWPACNQTGGSEAVGTHYIFHTHTPHLHHFFCPLLANHPKEVNKLHPFRISPPALNYHKQMQHRLTNWCELRFGVHSGSGGTFLWFPRGALASGTEPRTGIAAKPHNGGFRRVRFLC